ncbi:nose resistant to fluoxetine protein 6-like protein [Lates japonicus]|uniref:Nose resistant to fluoxetine protein 6-like protein n=1 Tax=Lates japonicus TaxID=270547 RepID=A0AAD3ML80_LATJO|nr:nose resistant to fluoxetine protein 6-like protein [Lates japonicus]
MGSDVEGGNVNQPGSQQQCRSAHGPTFSGQYCQVFLRQGTVQYFVGICVPDSCGEEDVQTLVLHGTLQFGQMSLIPPFPSILVNQSTQEMIMIQCLSSTIAPDASGVTCLFLCCVMIAVPLAATLFTSIIKWQRNREVGPSLESSCSKTGLNHYGTLKTNGSSSTEMNTSTSEENNSTSCTSLSFPRSCVMQCLQAFSLQNTCQGVLNSSSSIPGGGYSSLNGIRVLSLLWIICGHSALFSALNNLVMAVVVGLAYILKETPAYPSAPHALYQGLHRIVWALAVTWIILACEEGYGGFIKSFLSLGFWVPISNIGFACYLLHPVIMMVYSGLQATPTHYTDLNFMYLFLGHTVLTLVVSYALTVLVEKPFLLLKCSRTWMQVRTQ